MTIKHALGAAVSRARDIAQLTQPELAGKADCTPHHISKIESGRGWPRPKLLATIMRVCGFELRFELVRLGASDVD